MQHNFAARLAVDGSDQADTASVVFLIGRVGVTFFEAACVFEVAG